MDASYLGGAAPPAGVVVNLDNPDVVLKNLNYVTQALTILFVTIFVALKIYAKWRVLGGSFGWDDYTTFAGYIIMIGYCVCGILLSIHGGGIDQWNVPKDEIEPFLKAAYVATIHYAPMALLCKLALLILIARVFGSVYTKTIKGIYIFMGLLILYYVTGLIIKIRICWPISAYWKSDYDKCLDQSAVITADSIISVISDLAILLLPTPLTWSLNMPNKKKLRVIGVLCAGGLATAFSILRLGIILAEGGSTNQTVVFVKVVLSGNAEVGIGLICACLPSVNALVIRRNQRYPYSATYSRNYVRSNGVEGGNNTRIYVKRDFEIQTAQKVGKEVGNNAFELHSDDTTLVAHAQADPKDSWSTKSELP